MNTLKLNAFKTEDDNIKIAADILNTSNLSTRSERRTIMQQINLLSNNYTVTNNGPVVPINLQ